MARTVPNLLIVANPRAILSGGRSVLTAAIMLCATAAAADSSGAGDAYVSDEGNAYEISCNASGAVLTSTGKIYRFVGGGAEMRAKGITEKLYFGKACDSFSKIFGSGTWCQSNGAFGADFTGKTIAFPRQELNCSPPNKLPYCECH